MAWQNNAGGGGFYTGQQGYPYPGSNPGYPPNQGGFPGAAAPGIGFVSHSVFQPPGPGGPGQSAMYGTNYGEEDVKGFEFDDATIRQGFIRKVYAILMVQLGITTAIIAPFALKNDLREHLQRHTEIFWISFIVTIVMIISLACCPDVRRKSPLNFILLGIFTLAEGFLLACVTSRVPAETVLSAVGITAVICFALTLFSFQTKIDFTGMGTYLFVAVIVFMLFGIIAMFFPSLNLVYSCIGTLLFSAYLVYDTQIMIGGKHKYSISPEEYIFAALNLYLDIINIFLYILSILNNSRD